MTTPQRIMWNGTVRALPLRDQLHAAATAGCDALTITPSDYVRMLGNGTSTREMLAMAADAGVQITHLDPFVRWVDDWQPDVAPDAFDANTVAFDADDFFRMADALQVESFTAWGGFPHGAYEIPELIDAFGALCARAQSEGLRCDLEFIPVFGIPDLKTAWEIVRGAGAANSGIVLDLWHYMRGTPDNALLNSIPGEAITGVQLCDATLKLPAGRSLVDDGFNHRRLPGDGEFPIAAILDILGATGGLSRVGLEIFSTTFDQMTADAIGRSVGSTLDGLRLGTHPDPDVRAREIGARSAHSER
jgi:4-hydroxyphenylpyruvate dioxygenase